MQSNALGHTGLPRWVDSAISYATPEFEVFDMQITYAPDEGVNDTAVQIVKINYHAVGLKMGAGYMNAGGGSNPDNHTAAAFTASFESGKFSIGGAFQSESDIGGISGYDAETTSVGASFKIYNSTLKAQGFDRSSEMSGGDSNGWAVGLDVPAGDSTTFYLAYSRGR